MPFTLEQMVLYQLKGRGLSDEKVLAAMGELDRAIFVPAQLRNHAYDDAPLPIGQGQTISQPYIVGYMAEKLDLRPTDKLLEIGTGCGYNAAILSKLVQRVYSMEIDVFLAKTARMNLERAQIHNVEIKTGDGNKGWPENAPFNAIALTAAPICIPQPLINQLAGGGRLLAPVGNLNQRLILLKKSHEGQISTSNLLPVSFVPMKGNK